MKRDKHLNPSAFPSENDEDKVYNYCDRGMTLFDYYAAAALTGLAATDFEADYDGDKGLVAEKAFILAQCMVEARCNYDPTCPE